MRIAALAAASVLALAGAAHAQEATPAPEAAVTTSGDAATDAELAQYAAAMTRIGPIAQALAGAAPNAEQQAEMAAAVEASGLDIERFNAIAGLSADPVVQGRIAVAAAPESPAGSVGADIQADELARYARAATQARAVVEAGGTPTEQQAQMAAAVEGQGLTLDRFNAISAATSSDARLRARVALEQLKTEG